METNREEKQIQYMQRFLNLLFESVTIYVRRIRFNFPINRASYEFFSSRLNEYLSFSRNTVPDEKCRNVTCNPCVGDFEEPVSFDLRENFLANTALFLRKRNNKYFIKSGKGLIASFLKICVRETES